MTTTGEIMRDMERTRGEIRATIGAIEERVSVERLVRGVIAPAKAGTVEFGRAFSDAVRANPLALGVTAAGLGWLMLGPQRLPARAAADRARRLDPNRADVVATSPTVERAETAAGDQPSIGDRISETVRRAGASADETASRVREAATTGRARAMETVDRAADAAQRTSEAVRRSTGSAYRATRKTATEVGGRAAEAARKAGGYVRERPITVGAVVAVGGAALALMLARRAVHTTEADIEDDLAPAGMPETPYASGEQAATDGALRNPTVPLTPEEEEPVFAAGNVSAAAARPATEDNGGDGGSEGETRGDAAVSPARPSKEEWAAGSVANPSDGGDGSDSQRTNG